MSAPLVFLMGPTASGKTDLAVHLYRHLSCEIISVDSAMIYRGMDIGTAKPSTEILKVAPHRLIDICDPAETYSAARFRKDALNEIAAIQATGKFPLLTGGTGLYFRALEQGLADMPDANPEIRSRLEQEAMHSGWVHLHQRLAAIDPLAAKRIHPNDPQRIQRALEVYELTGRPISTFHAAGEHESLTGGIIKIILGPEDRSILHGLIAMRFHKMLEAGLLDEVSALRKRPDLHPRLPSMRLVGYRQVWRYLDGELDYQAMIHHAIVATRQLAKRQITWLRREAGAMRFNSQEPDLAAKLLNYLADKIPMAK